MTLRDGEQPPRGYTTSNNNNNAVTSMWNSLCPGRLHKLIALVAAGIILGTSPAWMQIVVIALGAIAGLIFLRGEGETKESTGLDEGSNPVRSSYVAGVVCLILFFVLLFYKDSYLPPYTMG